MSQKDNPFENFELLRKPILSEEAEKTNEKEETAEKEDEVPPKPVAKEKKEDSVPPKPKKPTKAEIMGVEETEEETEVEEPESKVEKTETEAEKTEGKVEDEKDSATFIPLIQHLTNNNILDLPDDFEIEDSEEGFEKAIGETVKKHVDSWKGSYPDEVQKLLQFVEAGGKPEQFYEIFYSDRSWSDVTTESVENQKTIIRATLKNAGWEDDEIDTEISDYEDLGKLKTKADAFLPKLQKMEQNQKQQLIKAQEELKQKRIQEAEEYWTNLKAEWFKKDEINGFKLTPKIKEQVWKHMSQPVDKKTGKTQLQLNMDNQKVDAQFMFAYLDLVGFDFKKLDKTIETKKVSELKASLDKFKDKDARTKTVKAGTKTVVDSEIDEDPFEAFNAVAGRKRE